MSEEDNTIPDDQEDEEGPRFAWKVVSCIIVALTLLLNIVIVGVIVVNRNANSVVNKAILTIGIVDLLYGIFVSPFFIENYVENDWNQSFAYCQFFEFLFTFHDLFVPLILILLSSYISLKFAGATGAFRNYKRQIYVGLFLLCLIISIFLSIPATVHSGIFMDQGNPNDPDELKIFREECRSQDTYTMVLTYFLGSSLLFCFTMSFLFSLCIVGSPLLRDVYNDRHAYSQRWRLLLTLSLVNSFYIISGFLMNFKEISRFMNDCCDIKEPFAGTDTLTYDIWSFILLIAEPFLRPLAYISFYFKYLYTDPLSEMY